MSQPCCCCGHAAHGLGTMQELDGADEDKLCPEATANIFDTLTFGWISPLMVKGFK